MFAESCCVFQLVSGRDFEEFGGGFGFEFSEIHAVGSERPPSGRRNERLNAINMERARERGMCEQTGACALKTLFLLGDS